MPTCTAWLPAVLVSTQSGDSVMIGVLLGGVAGTTVAPHKLALDNRWSSLAGVNAISPVIVCPHSRNLEQKIVNTN